MLTGHSMVLLPNCRQVGTGRLPWRFGAGGSRRWSLLYLICTFALWSRHLLWEGQVFLPGPGAPKKACRSHTDRATCQNDKLLSAPQTRRKILTASILCAAAPHLTVPFACPAPVGAEASWQKLPDMTKVASAAPLRFIAYLTRFLINFDPDFRSVWEASGPGSGPFGILESSEFQRNEKFARFARTVELAITQYPEGIAGSTQLLEALLEVYGGSLDARRQICILFSLLGPLQPVAPLRALLQQIENATVSRIEVRGGGVLAGLEGADMNEVPVVNLSLAEPPGEGGRRAKLHPKLRVLNATENLWKIESVSVEDSGRGYASDVLPEITLSGLVDVRQAPSLRAVLVRPGFVERDAHRALRSKETALLPSDLLPTYSFSNRRVVPHPSIPLNPNPSPEEQDQRLDEIFGRSLFLDRFRASFVFAEFDPTYGAVGYFPLERERRLLASDYALLGLSGGLAGFVREFVFLPIKSVKVRLQTDPSVKGGAVQVLPAIAAKEGLPSLFRAVDVACFGALAFSFISFGITEFLKREFVMSFPGMNEYLALILASACSVIVGLFVLTPVEALTNRVIAEGAKPAGADPRREKPFFGATALVAMARASGLAVVPELYEEYWLLLVREFAFVLTKFVVFDSLREALLFLVPAVAETQSLLVACACGAVAGLVATVVSHPIDTIFSLRTSGKDRAGKEETLPGLDVLFRGVGERILIYSPGIALTFAMYDFSRNQLGVGGENLMQTLRILQQ